MTRKMTASKRESKTPKRQRSNKVEYKGMIFDSETEYRYYLELEKDPTVKDITVQPEFQIIEPYRVACSRCQALGNITNPKTNRPNKCRRCEGTGNVTKPGAIYTADFRVLYIDGMEEIIDVKGYTGNQKAFFLRKKLFESAYGVELIIVKYDTKTKSWKRG